MKITTTLNGKHYESPLTREQLIALLDTDKTLDICFQEKQVYDRMSVLRGEWEPGYGESCFYVLNGYCGELCRIADGYFERKRKEGAKFFPDKKSLEEFLLIEKGEWVPENGDKTYILLKSGACHEGFYMCHISERGGYFFKNDGGSSLWDLHVRYDDEPNFFPSSAQRQAYIDKNKKPTLPTVEELREAWDSAPGIFRAPLTEMHVYLVAVYKSRFIAERIRKAEGETGEKWHVFGSFAGIDSVIKTASPELPIYGVEYFATEAGAELYRKAMGNDLQHLLTK